MNLGKGALNFKLGGIEMRSGAGYNMSSMRITESGDRAGEGYFTGSGRLCRRGSHGLYCACNRYARLKYLVST